MNLQSACISFILCLSCAGTAAAASGEQQIVDEAVQKLAGTIYVTPHTESVDGQLTGCGLEYAVLLRDFITQQGAPVKLVGSYYLRELSKNGLGYALKLGLIDGAANNTRATAPANAFVGAPRGRAPAQKSIRVDSDTPGYALYIGSFDLDVIPTLEAIYEQKGFILGFNRKPGQSDVLTPVDLRVVATNMVNGEVKRTFSDDAVNDFRYCVDELVKKSQR